MPQNKQTEALGWKTLVKDVQEGEYLFLDPDTGIDLEEDQGRQKHVRKTDLVRITRQGGRLLVLVFEHSYKREILTLGAIPNDKLGFLCNVCRGLMNGQNQAKKICGRCKTVVNLRRKLEGLCQRRGNDVESEAIHCGAVIVRSGSPVSYVWVSTNQGTVEQVRHTLLGQLRMPDWRLLACPCVACRAL